MTSITAHFRAPHADERCTPTRAARRFDVREALKRLLDIAGSAAGLLLAGPLIAGAAAIIKWSDPGPALYTQWRVGRGGRLFRILKLRTMHLDAECFTGAVCASRGDDRVIPACRWMRRCHVDELPQLINILLGEMSLVGPRPERPELMDSLRTQVRGFEYRLAVRPGLTGLAQVRMGYAAELSHHRRKLRYDMLYIRRRGLGTDLKLIGATLAAPWDERAA